jgi:hypothetical protein
MKYAQMFRLAGLLSLIVLAGCQQSPIATQQAQLDDLLEEQFDRTNVTASDIEVGGKWRMIEDLETFDCFGDRCYRSVYGLVNIGTGDTLRPVFDAITPFGNRILLMHKDWTAMANQELRIERVFKGLSLANDSLLLAWDGTHMGAIDDQLVEVLPMNYDSIVAVEIGFLLEPDYVLKVRQGGKWGLLSSKREKIGAAKYDAIYTLMGYTFAAKLEGKFGLVNSEGTEITPFKYDSIYSGGLNQAIIVDKKKLGLITMDGHEVIQPVYDSFTDASLYGCRCALRNGKYGVVSSAGEELSGFVYDEYRSYTSVHDEMQLRKNGKWGFFDCKSQKEVTPFIYDDVTSFFGYQANVLVNGKSSLVKIGE